MTVTREERFVAGPATSAEDRQNRLTLDLRCQVAVAPLHFERLMAQDVIDYPLIDTSGCKARRDRVAKRVQSANELPLSALERAAETRRRAA
jgi:hypothetical protein